MYEGNGILIDKENNRYEGDFKEGLKWGVGKLQWANEDLYTGEFYKGKPHGKVRKMNFERELIFI